MSTIGYAILVDLGNMKVFSINKSTQSSISLQTYQLEENFESLAKISQIYTDKAGDFSNSVSDVGSSYENKSDIEIKNRSIDHLGEFINEFANNHKGKLYLAASAPIHTKVAGKLSSQTKEKICKFLSKDLTKQNTDKVIGAFGLA
ncbi:host attachment protein [Thiomicrorhabdus sp. 6S3-12]|uniref:host attachment protein n=1 Tax=Thiomicrorhabdus sp. 6S3-12 TaxID=2819681 RepID=UPI001AACED73|nr:host attachment protein [Thiomicrorhabdus sp. 6S3-12]MBO1924408.1 host attachment protein [Thiomicrorhabdus sp. 6S3-12]